MSVKNKNLFDQIHRSILSSTCKGVAKELAYSGDWNLGSYIRKSVTTLARNTGYHERTVRKALKVLRSKGFITRILPHCWRRKIPTEYKLNFEAIQFAIEASKQLFKEDALKEKQRQFRKMERRLQREKVVQNFFFGESVDNIEKHDEITQKTPGLRPGNNRAIDYCINTVGFNNSVDNFDDMEVANEHNMEEFVLPCDIIGQPTHNLELRKALGILLMGKEGSTAFIEATRFLETFREAN